MPPVCFSGGLVLLYSPAFVATQILTKCQTAQDSLNNMGDNPMGFQWSHPQDVLVFAFILLSIDE